MCSRNLRSTFVKNFGSLTYEERQKYTETLLNCLDDSDIDDVSSDEDFLPDPQDTGDPDYCPDYDQHAEEASDINDEEAALEENITENRPILAQETQNSREYRWKVKNYEPDITFREDKEWNVGNRQFWTPLQYFNEYFDENFWELVSNQSNRKSLQDNICKPLNSTSSEYKRLVGAHIITGCLKMPRLRMYYRPSLRVPAITQIPRDRFFRLRNTLHFVDNLSVSKEEKQKNRLWKVQPIIDAVKKKCNSLEKCSLLSIYEQMIPFTGKTQLKQYVRGKPNPVGLKCFVLAATDGLVYDFFIYQGANTWPNGKPESKIGIGGSVVMKLTESLDSGHTIFCDRYFSSVPLFEHLLERNIFATGTIQINRMKTLLPKLPSDASLQKKGRGSFTELVREDEKIVLLKWMDNKAVTLLSSAHAANPTTYVKRWDKKSKQFLQIQCPQTVQMYNASMGGIDLCDRLISYYRINMRTKKWPCRVFWHFIDLVITNCWVMYKRDLKVLGTKTSDIMDLLEFKIYIGESLTMGATVSSDENPAVVDRENSEPQIKKIKRQPETIPTRDVRKTGNVHLPICAVKDKNKFMRCRNEGCTAKTRFKCSSCNIFLCIQPERQCFLEFHT